MASTTGSQGSVVGAGVGALAGAGAAAGIIYYFRHGGVPKHYNVVTAIALTIAGAWAGYAFISVD